MVTALLKVLTMEQERRNFQDSVVWTALGVMPVSIVFRKGNSPELTVTLKWIEKYSKATILKIWELASFFILLVPILPPPPPPLPSVCLNYSSFLLSSPWVIQVLPYYLGHHTHWPWGSVQQLESSGSHLLEVTGDSSAVIKLICSCNFSISNHSRKTEFPLLNTGRITLGSVDDLSKDFPPKAKWLMAYPSAYKTIV